MRPARPAEAAILAEMANDLNDHVGVHGRPFTPEYILRAIEEEALVHSGR